MEAIDLFLSSYYKQQHLLKQLDIKYEKYIQQLLIQKRHILFQLQHNIKAYQKFIETKCSTLKQFPPTIQQSTCQTQLSFITFSTINALDKAYSDHIKHLLQQKTLIANEIQHLFYQTLINQLKSLGLMHPDHPALNPHLQQTLSHSSNTSPMIAIQSNSSNSSISHPPLPSPSCSPIAIKTNPATNNTPKTPSATNKRLEQHHERDTDTATETSTSDGEETCDSSDDACFKCGGHGELICCDDCPHVFHPECVGLTQDDLDNNDENEEWYCPDCKLKDKEIDYEDYEDGELRTCPLCSYGHKKKAKSTLRLFCHHVREKHGDLEQVFLLHGVFKICNRCNQSYHNRQTHHCNLKQKKQREQAKKKVMTNIVDDVSSESDESYEMEERQDVMVEQQESYECKCCEVFEEYGEYKLHTMKCKRYNDDSHSERMDTDFVVELRELHQDDDSDSDEVKKKSKSPRRRSKSPKKRKVGRPRKNKKDMVVIGEGEELRCKYCNKLFARDGDLKAHLDVHVYEERPYKCHICLKAFRSDDLLKEHLRLKHAANGYVKCM